MKRKLRRYNRVPVKSAYTPFTGGFVDAKTPIMAIPPGHVRDSQNVVERYNGGYEWAPLYERFDGQDAPSDALYSILTGVITDATVALGDTITDDTAAGTGVLIAVEDEYIVLTKVTGTFATGNLKKSTTVIGSCTGPQSVGGASTVYLNARYLALAADIYRADIAAIPGSGAVRGLWQFNDVVYGFRDNAGGTKCVMHKSTASGWAEVALGRELSFTSGGTYEIAEGDVITGATGGATATITRVVLESGTWAGGDAAGRLIFASQTGTFQAENLDVGVNTNAATIAGDSSAIEFSVPEGRFEFITANFTGATATKRMYGVDGKNRGFEFDGTVFVPIDTGMTSDTPEHLYEHHNQLFYSFGGYIQHSSPGFPYQWSVIVGAAGLALGDDVTGFVQQPGDGSKAVLAVFSRNSVHMLYGTGVSDWQLIPYKDDHGAIEWSPQRIGRTFMLDDIGITEMTTTQQYGNFVDATVSEKVNEYLSTKKMQLDASVTISTKNQYWLFFQDKTSLCCTIRGGKIASFMPCRFPDNVKVIFALENNAGTEVVYFGDGEGMVYQLYQGTSHDGDPFEWHMDLAFDPIKSPMTVKKFRMGRFEVLGDGYAEFKFSYTFEYESDEMAQPSPVTGEMDFNPVSWDSATWDDFQWDGKSLTPKDFEIKGSGTNISLRLKGNSCMFNALTFPGVLIQYTQTRDIR